jgi:hypothetical protein
VPRTTLVFAPGAALLLMRQARKAHAAHGPHTGEDATAPETSSRPRSAARLSAGAAVCHRCAVPLSADEVVGGHVASRVDEPGAGVLKRHTTVAAAMRRGLAAGLALFASVAVAQVSPGPLSRSHASLEGSLNCFKCHGPRHEGAMEAQCLACHREIASLSGQHRGLHAREGAKNCATCHPEHGGADFELVKWDAPPASFDHGRAGWALEGKHAKARCADCHARPEFRNAQLTRLAPGKPGPGSYLGLETSCASCHEDIHKGALGTACGGCHGTESFRVPRFDHAKTAYPLTGRHATVACEKCHMAARLDLPVDRGGVRRPLFKPVAHAQCSDCHQDPHAGRLGPDCAHCHATDGFRLVRREAFDHGRTRYPLLGRHAAVRCERCHDPRGAGWNARPAFDRCAACHQDAHQGQAVLAGQAADCVQCHTVDGYAPATFNVQRHAETAYPLAGKHREVACKSCHPKAPDDPALGRAAVVLRPRHERCADCHRDAHGGQLARRPDAGACESCHVVDAFRPARYTAAEHRALRLPLEGKHASIACRECHGPRHPGPPTDADREKFGSAAVNLHPAFDCAACHADPHGGRFAAGGERPVAGGCLGCHAALAWVPSRLDGARHAALGFALEGAHRAVPCSGCHHELTAAALPAANGPAPQRTLAFRDTRRRCAECHEGPHGNQFTGRPDGGACESCHDVDSFRPASRFVHDRDTSFKLSGAHARVACARCHPSRSDPAGRSRTIYRPTPRTCAECHAGAAAIEPSGSVPSR